MPEAHCHRRIGNIGCGGPTGSIRTRRRCDRPWRRGCRSSHFCASRPGDHVERCLASPCERPSTTRRLAERDVLDSGAETLLIFDGVDEVPVGRKRDEILEQIGGFAKRFPKAQILVTSRPGAVGDELPDGFQKVVLEDLSEPQRLGFIDHWHQALAANFRREGDSVIAQLHAAALWELERQPTLSLLATNPLLCAAICALHWLSRRKVVEEAWQSGTLPPGSMQTGCCRGASGTCASN